MDYEHELDEMFGFDRPGYILNAGAEHITIIIQDVFGEAEELRVTPNDVIRYYAVEAHGMSGCRSLAGHIGDWRPIDHLASMCLEWFKRVNRAALDTEGAEYGMTLKA